MKKSEVGVSGYETSIRVFFFLSQKTRKNTLTEGILALGSINHQTMHSINHIWVLAGPVHEDGLEEVLGKTGLAGVDKE